MVIPLRVTMLLVAVDNVERERIWLSGARVVYWGRSSEQRWSDGKREGERKVRNHRPCNALLTVGTKIWIIINKYFYQYNTPGMLHKENLNKIKKRRKKRHQGRTQKVIKHLKS